MHNVGNRFFKMAMVTGALFLVMTGCRQPTEPTPSVLPFPSPSLSPLPSPQAFVSPLPSPAASSASWWPAGRVLYNSDLGNMQQVYLVADGRPATTALTASPDIVSAVEAAWSPDGQQIAFAAESPVYAGIAIYLMQADGSDMRRLMTEQPRLNWRPDWSPDGTQLLFQSNRDGNFEIYKANADGASLVNLTNNPANDRDGDWSPDGSKIVFVSNRDSGNRLYVMDADGSNVTQLASGWRFFPRWSPDGTQIALTSGRGGYMDIYVMNADGSDLRQVVERSGDDITPAWIGNDKLIFAGEVGDLSYDLFLVNVDGSGLERLTETPESEGFPTWAP